MLAGLTVVVAVGLSGCSISTDTTPSSIVIPATDRLSTEAESATPTTTVVDTSETAALLPRGSMGRVIATAPRVDNADFHKGARTPTAQPQPAPGFHFSTPQRTVACSIPVGGQATLACRIDAPGLRPRSSSARKSCEWLTNVITLSPTGPAVGACSDQYPVLYKSNVVQYGYAIAVSRITCLSAASGLFCIESRSRSGFAIDSEGYRAIAATQPAPRALLAEMSSEFSNQTDDTKTDSESTPTPVPTS